MEILHKAKRKDNGEWVEGYYLKFRLRDLIDTEFDGIKSCDYKIVNYIVEIKDPENHSNVSDYSPLSLSDMGVVMHEVDPETVCVHSGLNEKNGNKIWENDILEILEEMHSFTYQDGNLVGESHWVNKFKFKVEFTPSSLMNLQRFLAAGNIKYKVIGNAIDNPELLKRR